MRATVFVAVAVVVLSCNRKLRTAEYRDISEVPIQVVTDMYVIQTDKGNMQLRTKAPLMERYENDSTAYELFPNGFVALFYDESGLLETKISADKARHDKPKKGEETWMACHNVVIHNLIKDETMETDTLYWDRENERMYTDCYVQLYSPGGFMQGYGMESDQRARRSVILKPFNSYGIIQSDTTSISVDSVNFIGPFRKK